MCCCQTLTMWRSQWTGGMPKLINPCSSASSSMVCTQLVWWVLVHERGPKWSTWPELQYLEGTSCQCEGAEPQPCTIAIQGQGSSPQAAGSCGAASSFRWWGRHTAAPRVALPGLIADSSSLPGAACSCHLRARRKARASCGIPSLVLKSPCSFQELCDCLLPAATCCACCAAQGLQSN